MNTQVLRGAFMVALFSVFSSFAVLMPRQVALRVENQTGTDYQLREATIDRLAGNREAISSTKPIAPLQAQGSSRVLVSLQGPFKTWLMGGEDNYRAVLVVYNHATGEESYIIRLMRRDVVGSPDTTLSAVLEDKRTGTAPISVEEITFSKADEARTTFNIGLRLFEEDGKLKASLGEFSAVVY
jgi:hypothetical protein